ILKMRTAAEKAIELDPMLAEAHDALGMTYAREAQWEQSERSFQRSLQLDPNSSVARDDLVGHLLLPLGRLEEALSQARLAEKADPLSASAQSTLRLALFSAGRLDEAIAHCAKPCIEALLLQGKAGEAIP